MNVFRGGAAPCLHHGPSTSTSDRVAPSAVSQRQRCSRSVHPAHRAAAAITHPHTSPAPCAPRRSNPGGQLQRLPLTLAAVAAEAEAASGELNDDGDRFAIDTSPNVFEDGAPQLPKPRGYQQTLITSFTVGGVGLNTGEYAYVRVRPAYAGEGRYFVRVPPGTNASSFTMEELPPRSFDELGEGIESDTETEGLKLQLFQTYLAAREEQGFEGSFLKYLDYVDVMDKIRIMEDMGSKALRVDWEFSEPEDIQGRGAEERVWAAHVSSVYGEGAANCQQLVDEEGQVLLGVELLLSALEACGVDNARIEIEGGNEIPVVDGSALGWVLDLQFTGLRSAPLPPAGPAAPAGAVEAVVDQAGRSLRRALRLQEPFVVRDQDSFIQFVPEDSVRLTVGIDHSAAAVVIGKQWKSWSMYEDQHYRFELAGARQYAESPEEVVAQGEAGLLKAGTEGVVLVAHLDSWWDVQLVRYIKDEPVRHALVDLIGDLSLNALPGHSGLPLGHIIAYKPHHGLNAAFARFLHEKASPEDWVPVLDLDDDDDDDEEEQGKAT